MRKDFGSKAWMYPLPVLIICDEADIRSPCKLSGNHRSYSPCPCYSYFHIQMIAQNGNKGTRESTS